MEPNDVNLLYEIGAFRYVQRTWRHFYGPDFANNAEHSFRVAWIALLIAKIENIQDTGKIVKLALLHDLAESRTGDVNYIQRQYTKRDEDMAVADMFDGTSLAEEMGELWQEYEARETIESKIVKDADNIDVDLELQEQTTKGVTLGASWSESRKQAVGTKLYTEGARQIWEKLRETNPHAWHMEGRNRFTKGDLSKYNSSAKNAKDV
jgi:putative hydrolase of HD superfamily